MGLNVESLRTHYRGQITPFEVPEIAQPFVANQAVQEPVSVIQSPQQKLASLRLYERYSN